MRDRPLTCLAFFLSSFFFTCLRFIFTPPCIFFIIIGVSFFKLASIFGKFLFVFRVVIDHIRTLFIAIDKSMSPRFYFSLILDVLSNGTRFAFAPVFSLTFVEVVLGIFGAMASTANLQFIVLHNDPRKRKTLYHLSFC